MCRCWLSHCAAKPPRQRTLQQALLCEPGADSDTSSPAHSEPAIRNARCFSALLSLPIERKISRTMAMFGRFGREPKKAHRPLDNTYKQIFLHVINKRSFRLSKCSLKGEKYFCFYSMLSKRPASLMELCNRTVQCLHIFFWTLQHLLITRFLESHSALCDYSRTLIHVLKQYFHLLWKRNSLDLSRTSIFPAVR